MSWVEKMQKEHELKQYNPHELEPEDTIDLVQKLLESGDPKNVEITQKILKAQDNRKKEQAASSEILAGMLEGVYEKFKGRGGRE